MHNGVMNKASRSVIQNRTPFTRKSREHEELYEKNVPNGDDFAPTKHVTAGNSSKESQDSAPYMDFLKTGPRSTRHFKVNSNSSAKVQLERNLQRKLGGFVDRCV